MTTRLTTLEKEAPLSPLGERARVRGAFHPQRLVRIGRHVLYASLFILLLFIISRPILEAGFLFDDLENRTLFAVLAKAHKTWLEGVLGAMRFWLNVGRFYPLGILSSVSMHYLISEAALFQWVRVIFIWLSLGSFAFIIKQLSGNTKIPWLFLLLVPTCWSLRNFFDPLTAFAILLPLLTLLMAMTLIGFIKFQQTNRQGWLAASLLMYTGALCTYELGFTTLCLLLILNYWSPFAHTRSLSNLRPYFIITFILLATNLVLRMLSTSHYPGIEFGHWSHFPRTFLIQFLAAFPLSYRFIAGMPNLSFCDLFTWSMNQPHEWLISTTLFIASSLIFYNTIQCKTLTKPVRNCLGLLGLTLMTIPAAMVALSAQYQTTLTWGVGYLAVYLQYIGLAMGVVCLLARLHSSQWLTACLAMGLGFLLSYGYTVNRYVVMQVNDLQYNDSVILKQALQHQLLASLPENAILIEYAMYWNNDAFYFLYSGKRVEIYNIGTPLAINHTPYTNHQKRNYFIDTEHVPNTTAGYVVFGPLATVTEETHPHFVLIKTVQVKPLHIFITYTTVSEYTYILSTLKTQLHLTPTALQTIHLSRLTAPDPKVFITSLDDKPYWIPITFAPFQLSQGAP